MKKNHTILIFSTSIILLIISIMVLVFFFKIIENKNKHTGVVLTTLSNKITEKVNSQAIEKRAANINETKEAINSYFVNGKEIDSFINYLENLGIISGVELKVDSFEISPGSKNILIVSISTEGTFSNVMKALVFIENAPYKIHVMRTSFDQQQVFSNLDSKNSKKSIVSTVWKSEISFSVLMSS